MIKKIVSVFAAFTMLASMIIPVNAADTQNDYFEPTYVADDWTVTGEKVTFNSTKMVLAPTASAGVTAEYNTDVNISGDFVLTAGFQIYSSTAGNALGVSVGNMKFSIDGAAVARFYPDKNNETNVIESDVTGAKAGSMVMVYNTIGSVKIYFAKADEENKLLIDYADEALANLSADKIAVSVNKKFNAFIENITISKTESDFADDFTDAEKSAAGWTLASGAYGIIQKTADNESSGKFGLAPMREIKNNETACAYIKKIFTTDSYSLSFDYYTTTKNVKRIYLNKLNKDVGYEIRIYGEKAPIAVALYKGEKYSSSANPEKLISSASLSEVINHVKVDYDKNAATIKVYFNNSETPALTAENVIYDIGRIGFVAEYCNTGNPQVWFKNVKVEAAKKVFEADNIVLSGKIESGSTVTATTTVTNTTPENKSAVMLMALYNNDAMVKADIKPLDFAANSGKQTISMVLPLGDIGETGKYGVKCFIFDTLTDIKPLVRAASKYNNSQLILVGDSICQAYDEESERKGWGQYAQEAYDRKYVKVVNMAYAGYTTQNFIDGSGAGGYTYSWENIKGMINPGDTVFINVGINDMSKINNDSTKTYTKETYMANLTTMVTGAINKGANVALISGSVGVIRNYLGNGDTETYMAEVAGETGVPLLRLNSSMKAFFKEQYGETFTEENWAEINSLYYVDGLHVNETGARLILSIINYLAKDAGMSVTEYLNSVN